MLATEPTQEVCFVNDSKLGKQLTGFGREYQYLLDHGYYYDEITHQMRKQEETTWNTKPGFEFALQKSAGSMG